VLAMSVFIVASSEPRTGRSLLAAAIAYRAGRAGAPVTLARLAGDDSAAADATTFAQLEYIVSPGKPLTAEAVKALSGDVVLEAPAGSVTALAELFAARVVDVRTATAAAVDAPAAALAGTIVTRVPASLVNTVASRTDVLAVLPEDRVLAAPSVADIAAAVQARWLAGEGTHAAIDRVMIGTVASDAASPYFNARERKCVVTRFDKTDIQLAALQTDTECLVITGGGEPSPYLVDRVRSTREDIAVLVAPGSTVETMRAIEALYGLSRFDGAAKLSRAVEMLDGAGFPDLL
jgi:BioD-like phosphotransacetylase family protein